MKQYGHIAVKEVDMQVCGHFSYKLWKSFEPESLPTSIPAVRLENCDLSTHDVECD